MKMRSMGVFLLATMTAAAAVGSEESHPAAAVSAPPVEASGAAPASVKVAAAPDDDKTAIARLCGEMESLYRRYKWGATNCRDIEWEVVGRSVKDRPLLMFRREGEALAAAQKGKAPESARSTASSKLTLVQCGIHGDELASLPMCMNLINEIREGKRRIPANQKIAVQPLLNPDGMFAPKPTRNNAHGVDVNRNFPTQKWEETALASWKTKDRKDTRKFPGEASNSEPETRAIVDFVEREKPQKIISVHAPLGFLDLDARGPNGDRNRRAKFLAINMVKNSGNYKFRNFGVYPGSLGNFAGQERQTPVYTLELPSGMNRPTVDNYWKKFRPGLWRAIDFDLDTGQFSED